jgi:hypothetical protein
MKEKATEFGNGEIKFYCETDSRKLFRITKQVQANLMESKSSRT